MPTRPERDPQTAVIIGAGPAGLTAAYELLTRTSIRPVILEASHAIGGLSQTVEHHGNRMDIGGHRFFSKSDRVLEWWFKFLPLEHRKEDPSLRIEYQGKSRTVSGGVEGPDPAREDLVMLLRNRFSRIYYLHKLFRYPIQPSFETLANLGVLRSAGILLSYLKSALLPKKEPKNLEDFFVQRFGRRLYETFFKSYTEKVWGVPCRELNAEWGAQRVKKLSVSRAIGHALLKLVPVARGRKEVETSLIEHFLYPKHGPGQLWETVAAEVVRLGGEIRRGARVDGVILEGSRVTAVRTSDAGAARLHPGEYFFSTMPIKDLVGAFQPAPAPEIRELAAGLVYRDFVTVGLLLPRLKIGAVGEAGVRDNWIYIHDPAVEAGRLQIFNNWSPYLVRDPSLVWVGVEYFCNEGDPLWLRSDADMAAHAVRELKTIGLVDSETLMDSKVVRMKKAYPAYRGTYDRFEELRSHLDSIDNLFLIGRNGMHRYNNQDHSMLTAMTAVDNILSGRLDRSNLWSVNAEEDYHESKRPDRPPKEAAEPVSC